MYKSLLQVLGHTLQYQVKDNKVIVTKLLHRHQSIAFVYIDFLVYMQNELYVSQNKGRDLIITYIYDLYLLF